MDLRDRILTVARRETIERGSIPSLNVVVELAEVSKGGLIHHFPTRGALVAALADSAITELDDAMRRAAANRTVARTWLTLAALSPDEVALFRAIALALADMGAAASAIARRNSEATARWEAMIAEEVGDAMQARIIRLVGDGLSVNSIIDPMSLNDVDELIVALIPGEQQSRP